MNVMRRNDDATKNKCLLQQRSQNTIMPISINGIENYKNRGMHFETLITILLQ